jgi:hypothetical protein
MSEALLLTDLPPVPETWAGASGFCDGLAKIQEEDLWGALDALTTAVGPDFAEVNEEEQPFLAAAVIALASVFEKLGYAEAAVRTYDLALERAGTDEKLLRDNEWLRAPMESARISRDQLLTGRLGGERGPYYLAHVEGSPDDQWRPLYVDGGPPFEVGDILPFADQRWLIARIEPAHDEPEDVLGYLHVVVAPGDD